jgi:amidohydrolase
LMIREGALDNPRPDVIFGIHAMASTTTGTISYRPNGMMASADTLRILVRGLGTHGAMPWAGIDPIVVASQIVLGLQTITSRQLDIAKSPAIVSIGSIHGGVRNNIIPDQVEMLGTIRAFDPEVQAELARRINRTVTSIAESAGATATATITHSVPVTFNNPALVERMLPTLKRVAGSENVLLAPLSTVADDFAFYQQQIPGMFLFFGVTPPGKDLSTIPVNHSSLFFVDEAALQTGIRALANLTVDYLMQGKN